VHHHKEHNFCINFEVLIEAFTGDSDVSLEHMLKFFYCILKQLVTQEGFQHTFCLHLQGLTSCPNYGHRISLKHWSFLHMVIA